MFYTSCHRAGKYINVRGYDSNGKYFKRQDVYKPYIFVKSKNTQESIYRDVFSVKLDKKIFNDMYECNKYIKHYADVYNKKIWGLTRFEYLYIYDNYYKEKEIIVNKKFIKTAYIDIETDYQEGVFPDPDLADQEIISISLYINKVMYLFGHNEYKIPEPYELVDKTIYIKSSNERELFFNFLKVWKEQNPDIVVTWNGASFDIPYIVNRFKKVIDEDHVYLSPFLKIDDRQGKMNGREFKTFSIDGIQHIDYMLTYMKFVAGKKESYKLDFIAQEEVGENKINYDEYGSLKELYKNNFQKFMDYNAKDTLILVKLEKKLNFISMMIDMAYDAGVNYEDAMSSVHIWDIDIHKFLMNKKIVIPPKELKSKDEKIPGAYVKEPIPGMYSWVTTLDLASLYPSIMMQYNISPETIKGYNKLNFDIADFMNGRVSEIKEHMLENNLSIAANNWFFSKDTKGFIPEIISFKFNKRFLLKEEMKKLKKKNEKNKDEDLSAEILILDIRQQAIKILMNSLYGSLTNQYCRWYDDRLASAITLTGQYTIRKITEQTNKFLNKQAKTTNVDFAIGNDTDSQLLCLNEFAKDKPDKLKFVEELARTKISPFLEKSFVHLFNYMNCYENKMNMVVDCIADKGIWTAKKYYAMNVMFKEGVFYEKPKLKIVGLAAIKSTTPKICRKALHESLNIIFNTNNIKKDLIEYSNNFYKEFMESDFESIATPSSINGLEKYYDSKTIYGMKCPIYVKGALIYNKMLEEKNLLKKYQKLKSSEKIKYVYLRIPNPAFSEEVISTSGTLPKEFGLQEFIDYDRMFVKNYLKPLSSITETIGFSMLQQNTIDDYF